MTRKQIAPLLLILIVLGIPHRLGISLTPSLIVWNVGQGQWVTILEEHRCLHFDMGGEWADWKSIRRLCSQRENRVHFSHWDWDHTSFVGPATRRLPHLCIAAYPGGTPPNLRRGRLLLNTPACPEALTERTSLERDLEQIRNEPKREQKKKASSRASSRKHATQTPQPRKRTNSNASSRIFLAASTTLIPGDSTTPEERHWSQALPQPYRIVWLILGHHGSRTSTSSELLARLTNLRVGIASQRRARYGHPHPLIQRRLHEKGVAVLTTEDWGHIRLPLPTFNEAQAEFLVREIKNP